MRRLKRTILRVLVAALCVWLIACAYLLVNRRDLIYPFLDVDAGDASSVPRAAAVRRPSVHDGVELIVWAAPPLGGKPTILYFPGNAGSLPYAAPRLAEFTRRGYGLAALNYRGSGGAAGAPGEAALIADALTVHDALPDLTGSAAPPVIFGVSLGAALAVQTAARRPARAVLLEAPFARLCEAAEHHYPLVPACAILWDERWDSIGIIGGIEAPMLIQHGSDDRVIPLTQGQRLAASAPAGARLIAYPGAGHNDLHRHGAGTDAMDWLDSVPEGRD